MEVMKTAKMQLVVGDEGVDKDPTVGKCWYGKVCDRQVLMEQQGMAWGKGRFGRDRHETAFLQVEKGLT